MATDAERLRDRQADLLAAASMRKLQRQEDARKQIDEANEMTRRADDDDDDGSDLT